VTIGLRPETLDVLDHPEAGAISGTVDFVEELGSGRIVHTQVGEQTIAAAINHIAPEPGRAIWLRINPARLHAFCVETGKRLPITADGLSAQVA
jgi:sn-glycerol 3-phosphate transport system ATP-binding protein